MNVNNLVINRPLRFMMFDKTHGNMIMNLLDIKEPSLEISGETVYSTDSVGKKIAAFDRNKDASLTCQSTLFDLNLFAAQSGGKKVVAGEDGAKVKTPVIDMLEAIDSAGTKQITLTQEPVEGSVTEIGLMNNDGSVAKFFTSDVSASEDKFSIAAKVISLPTAAEVKEGTRWYVCYETELSEGGVSISASAEDTSKSGRGVLEVLFCDPCDQAVEYYGFLIFPNAKLKSETTIDFNTESTQSFTIEALQDWCSADKKLYELVVVDK